MGTQANCRLYQWLAIAFAVIFVLEVLHVRVTVDWFGPMAIIATTTNFLRTSTWSPGTYMLPLAIGGALWRMRRPGASSLGYTAAAIGMGIALFVLSVR